MKAIILAAGKGTRLGDLTIDRPKSMVNVGGRPIIDSVLDYCDHPMVDEIGIVGGFAFDTLSIHIEMYRRCGYHKKITLFENKRFDEGSIRTVMTAEDFLDSDFMLLNADHIYPKRMLERFIAQFKGITTACDRDRELVADDMKVKVGSDGFLTKIRKDLTDFEWGYIGSTYVPKDRVATYKNAMREAYDVYGKQSNIETVVGHLAANDEKVSVADLSGIGWIEVDTQDDLAVANEKIKTLL